MNTERATLTTDLLDYFKVHGVSHDPENGLQYVLDYQDVIGHSTPQEIREYEETLNQEQRKTFIWVNFLTLSQDMSLDILKGTVIHRFIERESEANDKIYSEHWNEWTRKTKQLNDCKKHIYRKIRDLERSREDLVRCNVNLLNTNDSLREQNRNTRQQFFDYRDKAEKFDTIKNLLT